MDITAENTFTPPVFVPGKRSFDISISGEFVATVTTQVSRDGGTAWRDVESFTAPVERVGRFGTGVHVRVGVKTGNFTSGIVVAVVAK